MIFTNKTRAPHTDTKIYPFSFDHLTFRKVKIKVTLLYGHEKHWLQYTVYLHKYRSSDKNFKTNTVAALGKNVQHGLGFKPQASSLHAQTNTLLQYFAQKSPNVSLPG